ncbi:leucine-rich repeat domain-containing protein [[Flexibacter] sp. ATCC 35103]|uniref:leucine-rich repeat domain-containing protein n=1 Tax=[Flexibacter] sp. ATCC 35103 TaxID=1937528 RepID=UPI0009C6B0B9|nr:leucine-rich repeat domain-containing protein [[Flexibacter] sp. ATCC 35103]OMQ12191.1 hypothetical protein BXU01_04745 [[Flexibacter] sp. ATCC 35103]
MKTKLLLLLLLGIFSVSAQTTNVPTYVPKDGLLAYFPFNGNATDVTGSGSTTTPKDVTLTSDRFGISNAAYSFNGTSSNIEANIVDYPLKGGSRSLTGWFKATDIITSKESDFCLVSFGNQTDANYWFKISFSKNGYLNIQLDSKTFQSPENYFNNQWTFYAMVFNDDTNTFSLYINNVLKLSGTADLYTNGFNTLFRIGKNKSNNYFEGTIDDIGVWNRVLTQEEITNLYNAKNQKPFYTLIPDINFENKLISLGIDSGTPDGEVLTENLKSVTSLDIPSSSIANLAGIQDFTLLTNLNVSGNQLKELDLTANKKLQILNCANNGNLTFVNIQNANNNILTSVNFKNNSKLTCIQVDDISYSNTNWSNSKDAASNFSLNCNPTTNIPDKNFEKKLISLGIDSGIPDGKILTSKISSVTQLDVSYSSIEDLTGIQDFTSLTNLYCISNQLTTLDLSKNTALKILECNNNKLATLNISKNIALTNLLCQSNKITNLDITQNTALKILDCNINLITNLNTSKNIALTNLVCYYNRLTNLDVSTNVALTNLDCNSNLITSLDLSKNTALKSFNFSANKLTSLNLKNGNNKNFFINNYMVDNPQLTCIQVDDAAYSTANWSAYKDAGASFNTNCSQGYTVIPDVNFENALISLGLDSGIPDGKVLTSNISSVKELNVNAKSISDLTGIQDFKSLTNLSCNSNKLTQLDVTQNTALIFLSVGYNNITSLNVSKNSALTSLYFNNNQVTSIDVSNNPALGTLYFSKNALTDLDISRNTALTSLYCDYNLLKTLNVSKNTILKDLVLEGNEIAYLDISTNTLLKNLYGNLNQLTYLNVSKNTELINLQCSSNKLTSLEVSKNTALTLLYCDSNQLTTLDVSKNTALKNLKSSYNQLTSLNLKNGNNVNFAKINFIKNPDLTCIQVDNADYSNENWSTAKDSIATYNTLCISPDTAYTLIPDQKFEQKLIDLGLDQDGINGKVLKSNVISVPYLSLNGLKITDLTGIEDFTALEALYIRGDSLKTLDVSKNLALTYLDCGQNQLQSLDISKNLALTYLDCSNNQLQSLDISKNTSLKTLLCESNQLNSLNLKNGNYQLLGSGPNQQLDFRNNPNLTCIQVDDVQYANTNWANKKDATATFNTDCIIDFVVLPDTNFEQKLIDLGIDTDGLNGRITTANIATITSLDLSNSNIKDLSGIENFTALTFLDCSDNQLTTLDVSKNLALETLNASTNQITTLDFSKNSKLKIVYVTNNPLISLNLQNGNNRNFVLPAPTDKKTASLYTSFLGLTTLSCIKVDDPSYSNANWSKIKEPTTTYSATCSTLGIEDSVFDKAVLYPNPTKGEVNINNIALEKATVYNSLGQLVKTFILNSGDTNNTINLSGLPKGIYYVYLINKDAASAKKVIVE